MEFLIPLLHHQRQQHEPRHDTLDSRSRRLGRLSLSDRKSLRVVNLVLNASAAATLGCQHFLNDQHALAEAYIRIASAGVAAIIVLRDRRALKDVPARDNLPRILGRASFRKGGDVVEMLGGDCGCVQAYRDVACHVTIGAVRALDLEHSFDRESLLARVECDDAGIGLENRGLVIKKIVRDCGIVGFGIAYSFRAAKFSEGII